ncbi:putative reverse transcriptase domain-containing protein [Tanacetum coccineum]
MLSCTKTQKYLQKGCHVFLAHITKKNTKDKSEEKKLKDVPTLRDFIEVFLEDFPRLSQTRQVEFQIDLAPDAPPGARAPYRLAPSEMKEELNQLTVKDRYLLPRIDVHIILRQVHDRIHQQYSDQLKEQIRYHLGKANVVADALSRKEQIKPLRVRALVMTIRLNLPAQILNAQAKAIKEENIKEENLRSMNKEFETRPDGTLCIEKRSWLPHFGGLRDLIMHESHKSKSSIHPGSTRFAPKRFGYSVGYEHRIPPKDRRISERTIQTLEDMLRACVIDFDNGWDKHLPLVEFLYNNSYHTNIKAESFEALYSPITSSASTSANKKPEYKKSEEKKNDKKEDGKKRDMSKVKCYNFKKKGHYAKDSKKAKVKDYNYYKTKMLLA